MPMKQDQGSPLWGAEPPPQKPLFKRPTVLVLAAMTALGLAWQARAAWGAIVRLMG